MHHCTAHRRTFHPGSVERETCQAQMRAHRGCIKLIPSQWMDAGPSGTPSRCQTPARGRTISRPPSTTPCTAGHPPVRTDGSVTSQVSGPDAVRSCHMEPQDGKTELRAPRHPDRQADRQASTYGAPSTRLHRHARQLWRHHEHTLRLCVARQP